MHPARDRRSCGGRGPALCTDPSPIPAWTMPGRGPGEGGAGMPELSGGDEFAGA